MTSDIAEVWTFLADVRRRRRRARRGRIAYALYLAALLVAIYGGPLVVRAVHSVQSAPTATTDTHRLVDALPAGLAAVWLFLLLGLIRQATWRGPILVSAPDADWMLPTPLPRSRVVGTRLSASLLTGTVVAAGAGLLGALILHGYGVARIGRLWLPMVVAAILVVALGLSAGALVERFDSATSIVFRCSPAVGAVAVVLVGIAVARAAGARIGWLQPVVLWSGPWGWCSQLVVQATGGAAGVSWPVAAVLAAITTLCVATVAFVVASDIPARALRRRAATAAAISAAVFLGETRDARVGIRAGRNAPIKRRRLPMPVRASLAVPWRDSTALLRAPATTAWAVLGLGIAGVALHTAAGHQSARHVIIPIAVAMLAAYAAGAQLLEPARLDADDVRRIRWSPYGSAGLARRHAVVATIMLTLFAALAVAVAAPWLGTSRALTAVVAVIATTPVVVAAALVGAYRGRVPLELIFSGADVGFGPTGPVLLVAWYLYGPLTAIAAGEVVLAPLRPVWHHDLTPVAGFISSLTLAACAGLIVYWWAGKRARDLNRSSS